MQAIPMRSGDCPVSASSTASLYGMPHGEVIRRHGATCKSEKPLGMGRSPAATSHTLDKDLRQYEHSNVHAHDHTHMPQGHEHTGPEACQVQDPPSGNSLSKRLISQLFLKKTCDRKDPEKGLGNYEPVTFTVGGMDCSSCGDILTRALDGTLGVRNARVTFISAMAECEVARDITTLENVVDCIQTRTRYTLAVKENDLPTLDLVMDRQTAAGLKDELPRGIISCGPLSKTHYEIKYDATIIGARKVIESIPGCRLAPPEPDKGLSAGRKRLLFTFWSTTTAFCLTIPVVVLSWAEPPVSEHSVLYISLVLGTAVQAIAIPEFYRPALSTLIFHHVIDMDMLVVISISAAYGYSIVAFGLLLTQTASDVKTLFETSTLLISLVLLGRLIAAYARKRAVAAVSLRSLQPTSATLRTTPGATMDIDARLLEYGDTILVRPHTYIVTDGIVSSGESAVNESMITGEALPVPKSPGDTVTAGTLNEGGTLTLDVTRLPGKNTVTDIASLVEQAHASKPRIQDLADKVAGYFVPVVVSISIIVTVIWLVVDLKIRNRSVGAAVGNAITYGIAVLAVSCPCALGLAVPMVLVIAGGVAARLGVIIKTADVTERGFKVTDVIFDKTGTLTLDSLEVVSETILERSDLSSTRVRALVKAMVMDNSHPISKALNLSLARIGVNAEETGKIESIPGRGVECVWNDGVARGGNPYWLGCERAPAASTVIDQGLAVYCVTDSAGLLAVFGLKTVLRKEAKNVVQALYRRGINVHIVSGDGPKAVESIASEVEVPLSQAVSRQTPEDKQTYIRDLRSAGKVVLFCGDGTNDAVAVTEANVGVQVESSSDITRASADVILLSGLEGVLQLLDISKAAYRRITLNFIWSAIYNIFAILLAGGAFVKVRIPPAYAGLGELVSVLPVVFVALTLLKRNLASAHGPE